VSLLRKTHLKQTQKPLSKRELDDDDFEINDEVTFGRNLRSRNFGKVVHEDDDLSDYVTVRLAVARAKAMSAYRQKWQT
jgi:hypothetical protein